MPVSKLDKAKAKRTGLLSALTKKIKSAVAEMDGTGDEVRLDSMRKELDDKLKACEQANDAMIELLDEATDVEDAYNWFSEAEESACDCIRSINAHLAPDQTLNASQGSVPAASKSTQVTTAQNTIDAWIDDLDPAKETVIPAEQQLDPTEILMRVMYEKEAPSIELPDFDGSPLQWPNFIQRFYEHVHRTPHFKDFRHDVAL